jgi:minor extracellular serine protease Vpr
VKRLRFVSILVPLTLLAGLTALTGGAAVSPSAKANAAPAAKSGRTINLATYPAKRWIVQLTGAPLATYRGGVKGLRATSAASTGAARLDATTARSRAYTSYLQARQRALAQRLTSVVPSAKVQRSYQVVLNGLAVKMSRSQAAAVRRMPGVRAVTPDVPYRLSMFSTPAQIGAPTLWGQVGGQSNAGAGVKVAIVDSGVFVRHDANGNYTGNPCFDDTGYTAPAGYPKGETAFTNNKVIVARAYFRPDDPPIAGEDTPIQGTNAASPHGTHVAGTVACNANTPATFQGANVTLSGVAPRAYLMNYRVFYPSQTTEDFQNGNAYVAELVKAIDQAVKDGADVISNSWGASYQNTLAWPDPMIQAAEDAVDAGVVMVFANGNAGSNTGTANSPAISPKVIGVGAVTKNTIIVPGFISVTDPQPVPANLVNRPFAGAAFGPQVTTTVGPAVIVPAENISTAAANKSLGCSLAGDASPFPAGSLTGKIALIERGTCNFSEKVFNAQRAGAIAAFIYNNAANGETLGTMGAGVHAADVTIPSWLLRRSDGVNFVAFANANPGTAKAKFEYAPHHEASPGDVMAGFSSRGPTSDKLIKPDVVAPGVNVVSGGYGSGAYPGPFVGFGAVSGTSMATPHVAGSAALLVQLHPAWTPAQIKSALMTTATEDVWTSEAQTTRAGVLDRGSGRIDLTRAGFPGITLDSPSLSAGEVHAGEARDFAVEAKDVGGSSSTWAISAVETAGGTNFDIVPSAASISVGANGTASFSVHVAATAAAAPGSYQGKVVLDNGGGKVLHIPVWIRVVGTPTVDVLLVDDDGSSADASFPDYSAVYTSLLTSLGVSYEYLDVWNDGFPSVLGLFKYRAVLIFTGNNDSFDTSGFSPTNQNALNEWLDSGGKLWTTGQNFAEESDSNTTYSSPSIGRARLYHGYLGLKYVAGSAYAGAAPRPTANGKGPMKHMKIDLSPGADGAGNQSSIELTTPMPDNDTYQAAHTMTRLFVPIDDAVDGGKQAIAFGRASEPSLKEPRQEYRYRSLSMGFGLEGVNSTTGFATRQQVAMAAWRWLADSITFGPLAMTSNAKDSTNVTLTASPASSVGAQFTEYRWDFGDGHGHNGHKATAHHNYKQPGDYVVRVEATDDLGHTSIGTQTIHVTG